MQKLLSLFLVVAYFLIPRISLAEDKSPYTIGVNDVLDISIIKPDRYNTSLTVAPDGTIAFPYIGNVEADKKSLMDVQEDIRTKLTKYMENPVVSVSLKESRSRIFYAYGEVQRPGPYPLYNIKT
jgi:protein involved in polysaccharide export with SLBB domain